MARCRPASVPPYHSQWAGLPKTENRPRQKILAAQLAGIEVQVKPLAEYARLEVAGQ